MKLVGFLKQYDPFVSSAQDLTELRTRCQIQGDELVSMIKYLVLAPSVWDWLSNWFDENGIAIGGASYCTDGEWIWPVYFSYYLNKYRDIYVDEAFLEHCRKNNYILNTISEERMQVLVNSFSQDVLGIGKPPVITRKKKLPRPIMRRRDDLS